MIAHHRKSYRNLTLSLLILGPLAAIALIFAPKILWYFAPNSLREIPQEQVAQEFYWRMRFYLQKATGGVPDLSWREVIQGTWPGMVLKGSWPGSGFIRGSMVTDGRGLDAGIENPLVSREDEAKGQALFGGHCAACHGKDGKSGHAPSLAKSNFSVGSSDLALYKVLRDGIPGTAMAAVNLSIAERWQVIAFLRALGEGARTATDASIQRQPVDVGQEALSTARSHPDEWLTYSGALDGWRHSPLREITAANVSGLKLRWAHQFATTEGTIQATPLVAGQTIFITEPPNNVVALEAKSGRELWKYVRRLPDELPVCCGRVNRGLAILGSRLYMGTLDAMLVALDANTGKVQWQVKVADPGDGFTITGAPLIAKDAVIVGVLGWRVRDPRLSCRLRSGHRPAALALQHHSRPRRGRSRQLGERRLEDRRRPHLGHRQLRSRPQPPLLGRRQPLARLCRRGPAGRQSLYQQRDRPRRHDREAGLVFPVHAARRA